MHSFNKYLFLKSAIQSNQNIKEGLNSSCITQNNKCWKDETPYRIIAHIAMILYYIELIDFPTFLNKTFLLHLQFPRQQQEATLEECFRREHGEKKDFRVYSPKKIAKYTNTNHRVNKP